MNSLLGEVVSQVVLGMVGVAVPAIAVYFSFYFKRLKEKMERKALLAKIDQMTSYALQARSFQTMDFDSRVTAVQESVELWVMTNDMAVHGYEIRMLIESSFLVLERMEKVGLQLHKLKMEARNEEVTNK